MMPADNRFVCKHQIKIATISQHYMYQVKIGDYLKTTFVDNLDGLYKSHH